MFTQNIKRGYVFQHNLPSSQELIMRHSPTSDTKASYAEMVNGLEKRMAGQASLNGEHRG